MKSNVFLTLMRKIKMDKSGIFTALRYGLREDLLSLILLVANFMCFGVTRTCNFTKSSPKMNPYASLVAFM